MIRTTVNDFRIGRTVAGGTANSVLFIDASGNLAEDNPGFTYIAGTGLTLADSLVVSGTINTMNFTASGDSMAIGIRALTGDDENTVIGYQAGARLSSGDNNTLLGYQAGNNLSSGISNTFLGDESGEDCTVGIQNVGVGKDSLKNLVDSEENTAVGFEAGEGITTGDFNTLVGAHAGENLTTGTLNTMIGREAGEAVTGSSNVMIGDNAGAGRGALSNLLVIANTPTATALIEGVFPNTSLTFTSATNTFTGTLNIDTTLTLATGSITDSSGAISFGNENLTTTGEATANVFDMPTTASATTGVINQNNASFIHTYGTNNLFIGAQSGNFTTTATGSTGIGFDTLNDLTTGIDNTCIGVRAGNQITEGFKNFAMGFDALNVLTTGSNNVAIGHSALNNITTGVTNVAIGRNAGLGLTVSSGNNVIIGNYALDTGNSDDIDRNTIIGTHAAGSHAVHASKRNVIIGYATGALLAGDDNIFIGNESARDETGSNILMIDNVDRTSEALGRTGAIIYGVMNATPANQTLTINASCDIGDSATPNNLAVASNGDVSFVGTAGFYPRRVTQSAIPAAGTGATQVDTGELMMWEDSDDGKVYLVYNDTTSGVKSIELV